MRYGRDLEIAPDTPVTKVDELVAALANQPSRSPSAYYADTPQNAIDELHAILSSATLG